jgi:ATP-dependent DNA helicase RecG
MTIDADFLKLPVSVLPMVGTGYAKRLGIIGITSVDDLLHHYPFRYDDLSLMTTVSGLQAGEKVTLNGQIVSITNTYLRSGKTLQKAVFSDRSGTINVTWFNQPYLIKSLQNKPHVSLSGKIILYRSHPTLQSPQYETIVSPRIPNPESRIPNIHTGRLIPIYHETYGISSKWLRARIKPLLDRLDQSIDWLPQSTRDQARLIPLNEALQKIHFPNSSEDLTLARHRLSFDELLLLQLTSQLRKRRWAKKHVGQSLTVDSPSLTAFLDGLPFTLTRGQQTALNDIIQDLAKPTAMNRLLQGDVGSGKTIVAAIAVYISYLNHAPAVFMAPTEILAEQHYATLFKLLTPFGLKIALHTHSQTIGPADADLYIGTHALLYRHLSPQLGLVVIDEQHRFGVEQRAQLLERSVLPNVLSMTATPIPRTTALTLYAELDISVIDELPIGRTPIKTWLVPETKRPAAYAWIAGQIRHSAAQTFIVCPLITDSASPLLDQVKAVESEYQTLKSKVFPNLKLGLLHGRLKSKDKAQVIQAFRDRKLDILVATPVIEVGMDIPQATIIVIEAAERFGLAQLHQLRGRVGRGTDASYCLLFTTHNRDSRRLNYLVRNHSGLRLAELDLKLRGPGDLYGLQQSGYLDLKIASLSDQTLITATYRSAVNLVDLDPQLSRYPDLRSRLNSLLAKQSVAN